MIQGVFEVAENNFREKALEVFRFQALNCEVYRQYLELLKTDINSVDEISRIPFIPIELFKTRDIITDGRQPEKTFYSSGTTDTGKSRHLVADISLYDHSILENFKRVYGDPTAYCFLFLLPSYMEKKQASIVHMAEVLMKKSGHPENGFYLYDYDALAAKLEKLEEKKQKTILFGVTFALLDLAAQYPMKLFNTIVLETGGMKGRREELTRETIHAMLQQAFSVDAIHSEYGMTELLSQAYSKGKGIFKAPPWMKVFTRDINDPLTLIKPGKTGGINIIDLANIYSCSFIATADRGKVFEGGSFEITGRLDNSDIRGCNLLYEN